MSDVLNDEFSRAQFEKEASSLQTIVAITTPIGIGAVGIVRVSGPAVKSVIKEVTKKILIHRRATRCWFFGDNERGKKGNFMDQVIAIYFEAPKSFTGEDLVEFQCHGNPILMNEIMDRIINLGVRIALPGEFTKRAFLNEKIDLTQAESICDLINSENEESIKLALNSLKGNFSKIIKEIKGEIVEIRKIAEASINFSDEGDIPSFNEETAGKKIKNLLDKLTEIIFSSEEILLKKDGITVAIIGKPNVGKSSLFNLISKDELSIVTEFPGTTRDIIKNKVLVPGSKVSIEFADTAGLNAAIIEKNCEDVKNEADKTDKIEVEGIKRAVKLIEKAHYILFMIDASDKKGAKMKAKKYVSDVMKDFYDISKIDFSKIIAVYNKIDLIIKSESSKILIDGDGIAKIYVSAKEKLGVSSLISYINERYEKEQAENNSKKNVEEKFMARKRHIDALKEAKIHLESASNRCKTEYVDLFAEEMKYAYQCVAEITGDCFSIDLLDKIFSEFCVGK